MARRSLRPHLNQIRSWVRQGRTDAWIAHQLEVTVQQVQLFKKEQDLTEGDEAPNGVDFDDEIDLRAEDDALIAAELDAAEAARQEEQEQEQEAPPEDGDESRRDEADEDKPRRRRGRRGGRRRGSAASTIEATFDHGEEGYGLWLDPAVVDNPVYAEHWAGHRPVEVTIEEDKIVIRRAGAGSGDDDEDE